MMCVAPAMAAEITAASPRTPDSDARYTVGFPAEAGFHRSAAGAPASMGPGLRRVLFWVSSRASFRFRFRWEGGEQVELPRQARRHRHVEVTVGDLGQHAAAWGALQEALLQQIRLDDLFEHIALVAERRRHRLDPDRAAAVMLGDRAQIAAVHRVEAPPVDFW